MTTIVFDGKTLVADTRRTAGTDYDDDAVKINQIEDGVYQGETILVIAGAGRVSLTQKLMEHFLRDPDTFETRVNEARGLIGAGRTDGGRCTLLILTNRHLYKVSFRPGTLTRVSCVLAEAYPDRLARKESVFHAIGKGAPMAETFHRLFNLPAHLCVALLAGVRYSATGGLLTIAEISNGKLKRYTAKVYDRFEDVHKEALAHLRSKNCHFVGTMPPIFGALIHAPKKEKPATTKVVSKKSKSKRIAKP